MGYFDGLLNNNEQTKMRVKIYGADEVKLRRPYSVNEY